MAGVRRPAEPHTLSNRAAAVKQFVCKLEDLLKRYGIQTPRTWRLVHQHLVVAYSQCIPNELACGAWPRARRAPSRCERERIPRRPQGPKHVGKKPEQHFRYIKFRRTTETMQSPGSGRGSPSREGSRSPGPRSMSPNGSAIADEDGYRPPSPRRRDAAAGWMNGSVWSQGGDSYANQYPSSIGSPGQDLHRYTEGPSAYLNGPPNLGSKTTLERNVHLSPRGRVTQGKYTGPAQLTAIQQDRKLACRRSTAGPDPYGLGAANLWHPKPALRWQSTFTAETGVASALTTRRAVVGGVYNGLRNERTPHIVGTTHTQVFDRYHVSSRNQWRHTSNSIKSILAHPMPQTPHGSSLLPMSARQRTAQQARMSAYRPMTSAHGLHNAREVTAASLRFGGGNPFH